MSLLRSSQLKNQQKIQNFDHISELPVLFTMKFEIIQEYKQEVPILKYWTLIILFNIVYFEI